MHEHGLDPAVEVGLLGQAELGEDRVGVLLDRPLRQHERAGDGGVGLAGGHLGEHLALAGRQPVELARRRPPVRRDQALDDLGVDHRAAGGDLADGGEELADLADALLQQVGAALAAVLEQGQRVGRVVVLAEHDDAHRRVVGAQPGGQGDALVRARRGHADVGHDDVRVVVGDECLQRREVLGDADQLDVDAPRAAASPAPRAAARGPRPARPASIPPPPSVPPPRRPASPVPP